MTVDLSPLYTNSPPTIYEVIELCLVLGYIGGMLGIIGATEHGYGYVLDTKHPYINLLFFIFTLIFWPIVIPLFEGYNWYISQKETTDETNQNN